MKRPMRILFVCLLLTIICGALDHASAQQSNGPYTSFTVPDRRAWCIQILELERLRIDPQNGNVLVYPQDQQLYFDYIAVVNWMHGFVAGRHVNNAYNDPQIAIW